MINDAIRVGIEKNITSKLTLRNELYLQFKNEFHTSYYQYGSVSSTLTTKIIQKKPEEKTRRDALSLLNRWAKKTTTCDTAGTTGIIQSKRMNLHSSRPNVRTITTNVSERNFEAR